MAQQPPQSGFVTVEIYDQTYHLSGQDLERTRRLAARVDERMRAVASAGRTADSLRVAVLAALNLADELTRAEQEIESLEAQLRSGEPGQGARAIPFPVPAGSPVEQEELEQIQARAASLNRLLDTLLLDAETATRPQK
jgi:cell division protein ZapA (FtsZ GTPase activity inhibitor)